MSEHISRAERECHFLRDRPLRRTGRSTNDMVAAVFKFLQSGEVIYTDHALFYSTGKHSFGKRYFNQLNDILKAVLPDGGYYMKLHPTGETEISKDPITREQKAKAAKDGIRF